MNCSKNAFAKLFSAVVVAAVLSHSAHAGDVYVWTNSTDSSTMWTIGGNWLGGEYPVNNTSNGDCSWGITNSVMYFTNEVPFVQDIGYDNGNPNYWTGWKYGELHSDRYHRIVGKSGASGRMHTVNDARDFEGLFIAGAAAQGQMLIVHDDFTNTLPQAYIYGYPRYAAYGNTYGTGVVSIAKAFGEGTFMIGDDQGNADIGSSTYLMSANVIFDIGEFQTGPNGHVFLNPYANLALHGRANDEPGLASGAALHLDASDSTTYDISGGSVTTWRDVDGGSIYATAIGTPTLGTSTNGLAVVKCASGSAFTLSSAINAREIFLVFRQLTEWNAAAPAFVGNSSGDTEFLRSTTKKASRYWGLFAGGSGAKHLEAGEVWYDGTRTMTYGLYDDLSLALHVVSGSLYDSTAPVEFIGAETASSNVGGIELAEVLVYTNELSSAQRRDIHSYLRAKWQSADMAADWDFGSISVLEPKTGHGNISVEDGSLAVREIRLKSSATTFSKDGSGTLEVGSLYPEGTSVEVDGGGIAFRNLEGEVKKEMAANPSVWLDASQSDTFVYDPTNSSLVCQWNDPRGTNHRGQTIYATNTTLKGVYGRSPEIVYDTPTGLAALDFGTATNGTGMLAGDGGDAGAMKISNANFREGFLVIKATASKFIGFSTGGSEFFDGWINGYALLSSTWCSPSACGGYWTVNGTVFDAPYHKTTPLSTGTYYVIGLRLSSDLIENMDRLAVERATVSADYMGGVSIAEVVYYDRILTPNERHNTEAYLMDKWLGEEHPAVQNGTTISSMKFADGVSPTIDTDVDMTIGSVEGTGTIVKKGAGDVTISGSIGAGVEGLDVQDGSLSAAVKPSLFSSATLHLDASDTNSFDYADNGTSNEVTAWHDCDGRSEYYAQCQYSFTNSKNVTVYLTNGVLTTTSDTTSGLLSGMNYVSFGATHQVAADTPVDGAGMRFSDSAGNYVQMSDVREMHYVFRRTEVGNNPIVGSASGPAANMIVPAGTDYPKLMYWPSYTEIPISAPKKLDDDSWHCDDYWLTSHEAPDVTQFYVGVVAFTGAVSVNSIALDRSGSCGWGGIDLCELIIYTGETNTLADTEAIHSWLMKKWKGLGEGAVLDVGLGSVSVSSGASLSLSNEVACLQLDSLNLDVLLDASGCNTTTFSGACTLPSAATVTVSLADGASLAPGDYPILTAGSLDGSLGGWTLDTTALSSAYTVYLVKMGSSVILRVGSPGLIMLFK